MGVRLDEYTGPFPVRVRRRRDPSVCRLAEMVFDSLVQPGKKRAFLEGSAGLYYAEDFFVIEEDNIAVEWD